MTKPQNDKKYMQLALRLAKKGAGSVSPNPMVGAVFVRQGKIIGKGYHKKFGGAHAEINAIADADGHIRGATLYCTLEPCSHSDKKTPPCAQRLVEEKVRRVVIGTLDPNPKVNGGGIRILKAAGIEVKTGILEKECRELNRFFIKFITTGLPYVTVKIAQTLDGFISVDRKQQTLISNAAALKRVHQLRSVYDAVLIGAGTIRSDDPQLTVRLVKGRDPVRVLLERHLEVNPTARVFRGPSKSKTIVFTAKKSPIEKIHALEELGVHMIPVGLDHSGRLPLKKILHHLHSMGIASILVEGGQKIFTGFLKEGLNDELLIFVAPVLWGSGLRTVTEKINLDSFQLIRSEKLSNNLLLTFRQHNRSFFG